MTTRADHVRTDQLDDAAVRVSDLPKLFGVSRSTIDAWIAKDSIRTFEHPVAEATGRPPLAVRFGDLPINEPGATRWRAKGSRKNS
ncbi:hypothetical protein [Microbacterium sp. PF5]|uniref:hypothetical protein n=1 Tax=Microbacterium sp. PF5 TaxID=2305435 RepID=UPI00109BB201|nr:hypothetical protein [Microbacterium sp. PF5]